MFAQKENRVYKVTEENKKDYLKRGFDIYDEDGNLVEANPNKTISYAEHTKEVEKLQKEIEKLQKEIEKLKTPKEGAEKGNTTKKDKSETPKEGAEDGKVQE